jgi:hypothetical protein
MKSKTKKVNKKNKRKKYSILDMTNKDKCLLNHCLPEYEEYQEQIPNNFKISLKTHSKKVKIIKNLEKCSKKYCSK